MKSTLRSLSLVMIVLLLGPSALARGGGSGEELSHFLTVGGGISSPSPSLSLYENPTGIAYNEGAKIQASVIASEGFDPANPGGHLLLGNGAVGGAIGYRHYTGADAIEYALGASLDSVNLALGVGGSLWLNDSVRSSDLNLGFLYNPLGKITFGGTVFGLTGGVNSYGAGFAFDLSQSATLAADVGTNGDFNAWSAKPGLGIHLSELQLTVGYGFDLSGGGSATFNDGVSVGIGFRLGNAVNLAAYYEQLSKYYISLQFRL